jgi:hypothetical protein
MQYLPNYFPDVDKVRNARQLRIYVRDRMEELCSHVLVPQEGKVLKCSNCGVEMPDTDRNRESREACKEGAFVLSVALQHPEPLRTLVGDVILGYEVDNKGNQQRGIDPPDAVRDYRVRVRSLEREKIDGEVFDERQRRMVPHVVKDRPNVGFKLPAVPADEALSKNEAKNVFLAGEFGFLSHASEPQMVPQYEDTGSPDVVLPLKKAIWALRQNGKHVKRAKSKRLQDTYWLYEEVPHGQKDEEAKDEAPESQPTKRRGRPPKSSTSSFA